jgi:hypothetical protein
VLPDLPESLRTRLIWPHTIEVGLVAEPVAIPHVAFGQDRSRRNRVHPYAVRHELQSPTFGIVNDRRLGRAVLAGARALR